MDGSTSRFPTRDNDLLLPAGARLFHIGPHKTGTTALQGAAAARRQQLLECGVLYPGRTFNQRIAISAFMGKGLGWNVDAAKPVRSPPHRHWRALLREMEHERERRVLFGHETASGASDEHISDWARHLGPRLHVVLTLRAYNRMLPSLWQETLKRGGGRREFDRWLRRVVRLADPEASGRPLRLDHAGQVRRWTEQLGPRNVTVVVLDPGDQAFMFHAFEDLLGLPVGLLASASPVDHTVNRSMSATEAELFRRLNLATREAGLEFANHEWLNYDGAIRRVINLRTPGPREPRLELPAWAVEAGHGEEIRIVTTINQTGVTVIGDTANLLSRENPQSSRQVDHRAIESVPMDLAVTALMGVIARSTGRDPVSLERTAASLARKFLVDLRHNMSPLAATLGNRFADEALIRIRRLSRRFVHAERTRPAWRRTPSSSVSESA